jgi:hypothetical protein
MIAIVAALIAVVIAVVTFVLIFVVVVAEAKEGPRMTIVIAGKCGG